MSYLVPVVSVLAIVTMIAVVVLARRLDTSRRIIRSMASALGTSATDADLLRAARQTANAAQEATTRANSYAAALQGATTGIALLEHTGAVQYANPAAQMLLEGPREKAVLRTRVTALGQRVHTSGEAETIEVDIHDPDRRVLSLTAVPVAIDGGGLGSVCLYIEDLSAQRRVDAMRTDFVANASHELKTPLGALALLAETLADADDEEMRIRLSQRLQTEATRMANVIDDVLQLAETESLGAEYVHVRVSDILEEAVKAVESIAADNEITILRDDIADATVAADRDQLISAFTNLLQNAVTYTAVKGEPGFIRYRSTVEDGQAHIEIEDTGIGIPVRYTDRVFERFFRVDRARSRESGGSGLGLSIVRNVARAHGGTVGLRSKVGVGSTFTISLPIVSEEPR
jgi:two-component system sensor histidine kinase SenX3